MKRTAALDFFISASNRCNRIAEQIIMKMGPANRIFRPQQAGQHVVVVASAETKCLYVCVYVESKDKTARASVKR